MKLPSLRARLMLLVLCALLPALLLTLLTAIAQQRDGVTHERARLQALANDIAAAQQTEFGEAQQLLTMVAGWPVVRNETPGSECGDLLTDLVSTHPQFAAVWVTNGTGVVLCSNRSAMIGTTIAAAATPGTASFGGFLRDDLHQDAGLGVPVIDYLYPSTDAAGQRIVAGVSIDAIEAGGALANGESFPDNATVAVLEPDGAVALSAAVTPSRLGQPLLAGGQFEQLAAATGGATVSDVAGTRWLYALSAPAASPLLGLRVAAGVPLSTATAGPDAALRRSLLLLAMVALLAFVLAWWAGRRWVGRLSHLAAAAARLSAGDLTARVSADATDEVGRLASAFDSMAAELQRRSEELQRREQRFRALIENSTELVTIVDAESRMVYVSPSVERLLGYPVEHFASSIGFGFLHDDDLPRVQQEFMRAVTQTGLHHLADVRLQHADGSWRWFDATLNNLLGDPAVGGIVCTLHDVTERRQALGEARAARESYEALFADAPVMYAVVEQHGNHAPIVDCNALFLDVLGYSRDEVVGRTLFDFMSADIASAAIAEKLYLRADAGELVERERDLLTRDGKAIITLMRGLPEPRIEGQPYRVRVAFVDISSQRQALLEARQAQQRYRALFEDAPAMYAVIEEQGERAPIIDCNALFLDTLGYSRDEVIGRILPDLFTPESARIALAEGLPRHARISGPIQRERDFLTHSGEVVHTLLRATPEESEPGAPFRVRAMFIDVTAQRETALALRETETRLQSAVANVQLVINELDAEGRFTFVDGPGGANDPVERRAMLGRSAFTVYADYPTVIAALHAALAGLPGAVVVEIGGVVWDVRYAPKRDHDGAVVGVSSVALDITDRARAEAALRAQEEGFKLLFAGNPHPMWVYEKQSLRFLEVNEAAIRQYGYSRDEFLSMRISDIRPPEDIARLNAVVAGERNGLDRGSWRHVRKNGDVIDVEIHAHAVSFAGRAAALVVAQDITARLRAEEALREEQARTAVVLNNVPVTIYSVDRDGVFAFAGGRGLAAMGVEPGEVVGFSVAQVYDGYPESLANVQRALAGETVHTREVIRGRTLQVSHVPLFDDAGRPNGLTGIALDVTDRLAAESALREAQEQLRTIVGNVPMLLFKLNQQGEFTMVARGNSITLPPTADHGQHAVVGRSAFDAYASHPDALDLLSRTLAGEAAEGLVNLDGVIWDIRAVPVRRADGTLDGATGVALDVTARRAAEEALREARAQLQTLVDNVPLVLFRLDRYGVFTLSEGQGLALLGLASGSLVGRAIDDVYRHFPVALSQVRSALAGETIEATIEVGAAVFDVRFVPERDASGEVCGVSGVALDATARRRIEDELAHQAYHDALTGLPNRALFLNRLDQALLQADRRREVVGLLFLDLDQFKVVNDSLGHSAGDALLVEAAARIAACVRPNDLVARLGGDEFTVVLTGVETSEAAREVGERVLTAFQAPFVVYGHEVFVTPSIGVACANGSAADLLRRADVALYQAKAAGRACVVMFDEQMDERARERLSLETDLHRAIERGELRLFYQPEVALMSGAVVGVEALVRWQHPERGLIPPNEFIPLSEETGLILPLGRWVLGEACRQGAAWLAEQPDRPLTVAVNLSARQLMEPDLAEQVAAALEASGFPAASLELELTESMVMGDVDGALRTLQALKLLGVRLAMDDFGTGYSSLSYLARLPVDTLKIDQSFVRRLHSDSGTAAIVEATVGLAHALGMSITAEGIETPEDLARLRALRCERGQGYYFCRPAPAEALRALLFEDAQLLERPA